MGDGQVAMGRSSQPQPSSSVAHDASGARARRNNTHTRPFMGEPTVGPQVHCMWALAHAHTCIIINAHLRLWA